ncbi:28S ribosomal protein S23, mitochondrial isoform X2 [Chelmon rostratus]|uniref:28S ribosomal protein S23, mitochondrial isoform X2 n=1 Tax=Chelmon rostratus TaxID=109905 RepID=UPI001BE5151D|nr:28S ribosomal protein S23, mitochondrial isoform X2 [Chelmon rostratus]
MLAEVRDLICAGVIKPAEKPIWYDVYRVFPPKRDPLHVKPHTRHCTKKQEAVPEIFYREDEVRAKFYEQYGMGPRPFDLSKSNFVSTCQRFVDKYTDLKRHSELEGSALFEETGKALLTDGIALRRRGAPPVSVESRDPVLKLKLTDMLAEQRSVKADSEEAMEHTTHTHVP